MVNVEFGKLIGLHRHKFIISIRPRCYGVCLSLYALEPSHLAPISHFSNTISFFTHKWDIYILMFLNPSKERVNTYSISYPTVALLTSTFPIYLLRHIFNLVPYQKQSCIIISWFVMFFSHHNFITQNQNLTIYLGLIKSMS